MNFLLDTHTFLWYFQQSEKLPPNVSDILEDRSHGLYLSIASLWEMTIKLNLGKLSLDVPFSDLQKLLEQFLIEVLPISFVDTENYLGLPLHHRDPFDRILVAQTTTNSLSVLSADTAFDSYSIHRAWTYSIYRPGEVPLG